MHACLDLGSNSFHLLIAECRDDGSNTVVERFSEKVQLGERVADNGYLQPGAIERGLACLRRFRDVIRRYPVSRCWSVGTNALRTACNADYFLTHASELGFPVDVVSGEQEAVLIYAGVVSALPAADESRLVIDIGGGSTEIIVGRGEQRDYACSLPIGCVIWRDRYFGDCERLSAGEALDSRIQQAVRDAESATAGVLSSIRRHDCSRVYASSGTAKMLNAICRDNGYAGEGVTLQALLELRPLIVRAATDPDFVLPGLKESRRQLALPGWCVLTGLMRRCGIEQLRFSPAALREGMLYFLARPDAAAAEGFTPAKSPNALTAD